MKRNSRSLEMLRTALWRRFQDTRDQKQKEDFRFMHSLAKDSEREYDKMFGEIEIQMLRNPAFPDDFVGYPDDDMRDFEENEAEKKNKKDNQD